MTASGEAIAVVSSYLGMQARPAPAAGPYVADLFRKLRSYAEHRAAAWFVSSAKHGLIEPATEIEPCNLALNPMEATQRRASSAGALRKWERVVRRGGTVIMLAGARCREGIVPGLEGRGAKVQVPMVDLRIGEMSTWLVRASRDKP